MLPVRPVCVHEVVDAESRWRRSELNDVALDPDITLLLFTEVRRGGSGSSEWRNERPELFSYLAHDCALLSASLFQ